MSVPLTSTPGKGEFSAILHPHGKLDPDENVTDFGLRFLDIGEFDNEKSIINISDTNRWLYLAKCNVFKS